MEAAGQAQTQRQLQDAATLLVCSYHANPQQEITANNHNLQQNETCLEPRSHQHEIAEPNMVPVHEGRSSQSFPKNPEGQFCDQRESNPSDQIVYQETNHNLIREANHNHNLLAIQWEGTADVLYDCTLCDHCVCHDPLHQHKDFAILDMPNNSKEAEAVNCLVPDQVAIQHGGRVVSPVQPGLGFRLFTAVKTFSSSQQP